MDNLDQLRISFYKYVNNQADANEARDFLLHLQSGKDKAAILSLIEECLASPVADDSLVHPGVNAVLDDTFENLLTLINPIAEKRRSKLPLWLASAAAIVAVLGIGLFFSKTLLPSKFEQHTNEITPGGNKAVLTLANGQQIALHETKNGILANESNTAINKTADGEITYQGHGTANAAAIYNTLKTPRGGQYTLTLSDGTKVTLNAESMLKYPIQFKGNKRVVELSGEGYFQVARDKARVFSVISKGQEVDVLGTHFDVNAYADEPVTKTTLLEGSVKVRERVNLKEQLLIPGQQAILKGTSFLVTKVDPELAVAWKDGMFSFHKQNLRNVMNQISRWYDVEISYEDGVDPDQVFAGSISMFKNVAEVLEILELTKTVKFKIEGRRITVMK